MRTKPLDKRQQKRFRESLSFRWRIVWDIGVSTGLRISDILDLRTDDFVGGRISLVSHKTGKPISVALPKDVVSVLERVKGQWYLFPSPTDNCKPVSRQAAYKAFKTAARTLALPSVGTHTMRKCFAINMFQRGCAITSIQAALQHDRPETTLLYLIDVILAGDKQL